jgi:ubiquinone/menaquinone biosynthesis C-methylase UbiE
LRVPPPLQWVVALGLLCGLAGLFLLFSANALSPIFSLLLIAAGALSGVVALSLWVVTSQRLRERARSRMLASVAWRGDERVLDVGCGNGFLLIEIAGRLTTGRATGIDLWKTEAGAQTADTAWRNARAEGVEDRIDIRNVDARTMPFGDQSFDVIVSSLMLHHAGGSLDRERVVGEMLRVLKPGGTLLLYDAFPLITTAARQLRDSEFTAIQRSRRIMSLLVAQR